MKIQTYEQQADQPIDVDQLPPEMQQQMAHQVMEEREQQRQQQEGDDNELFSMPNDLRVIQEYNREENIPQNLKKSFWSLASKSIKLGFWRESDLNDIFIKKNIIKVGHIMSQPRHRYTFAERQMMNQMDFLVFADFKRGIGMEKYKINERTLQATSVQQQIVGSGSGGAAKQGGGVMSGLKSFFG